MADTTENIIYNVIVTNMRQLEQLEQTSLRLRKSINTALDNNNKTAAKGFRTQLRHNNLEIASIRQGIKEKKLDLNIEQRKQKTITQGLANQQRQALTTGLAFLFFGMAVKQSIMGFGQAAFTAFNKYNTNTELANNATNRLAGGVEFLRYTIGAAFNDLLEDLEPMLSGLIDWLADLVDSHPKLVAVGTAIAFIGASFMMAVGQIGLFLMGVKELGLAAVWTKITTAITRWYAGLVDIIKLSWIKFQASLSILYDKFLALMNLEVSSKILGWSGPLWKFITTLGLTIAVWAVLVGLLTGQEPVVKMVKNFVTGIGFIVASFLAGFKSIWDAAKKTWENIKEGNFGKAMNPLEYFKDFKAAQKTNLQWAKEASWDLGDTFESGLKQMTDALGTTEKDGGWNNIFKDISNKFGDLKGNLESLDDTKMKTINVNVDQKELIDITKMNGATNEEILAAMQENNRILEYNASNSLMAGAIRSGWNTPSLTMVPFAGPNQ